MIGASGLTIGVVLVAALADSINPCVLGVLIFLIAFLTRVFRSRRHLLIGGLLYTAVVYATYLALGFGILRATVSIGVATAVYWVAAIIAIVAGVLELKDFFWYGKGFTLQMIPGGAARLKYYTAKIESLHARHPRLSIAFIGLLGVFVVLVELPCTGAPYFAILALLAKGSYAVAVPYLLLYNFVFIVPLLIVLAVAYAGRGERLEAWRLRHRHSMRLGIGVVLVALGAYMIFSIT